MTERETAPFVSIGLPVYNGERYLAEAIQSILNQTYRNLELIICDNDSTDRTAEICRRFAACDARIRYFRNQSNLGAARNFNLTLEWASGVYFKWHAADDLIAAEFVTRSVEVLEADRGVVLCQSQVIVIDEIGNFIMDFDYLPGHASSTIPSRRLGDVLRQDRWDFEVFGLIRTDALRRTRLLDYYVASDRVLRAELALFGRYHILPERLFFSRDHPNRSVRAYPAHHLRVAWFDPRLAGRTVFPHWRVLKEYGRAVARAPLSRRQRICCYGQLVRWLTQDLNWARLAADIVIAVFPGSWRWLDSLARSSENWLRRAT
jgi:glycosyltransferase involved in cell wall biosynthesis